MLNNNTFKKTIIAFWAAWWIIALWTDIVGGLAHLGLLQASWAPDQNYPFLVSTLKMYPIPDWLPPVLFIGIIIWSFASALLFLWAVAGLKHDKSVWMQRAQFAFIVSITFWLAFFLADQLVMKFDEEQNHMVQGGFELLTYLALVILPDDLR